MGASTFYTRATGATAKEAFRAAQAHATICYGHQDGYSGAVNAKDDFVMIQDTRERVLERTRESALLWATGGLERAATPSEVAAAIANALVDLCDERIASKWGPAGCIQIAGTNEYLFFGWAPS